MKNQNTIAFTTEEDPITGLKTLVPISEPVQSIEYSTEDLKKWVEKGLIPEELGKYALKELERVLEIISCSEKMEKDKSTPEEWIELFKKGKTNFDSDNKKAVDLAEFLLKNKKKLLKILSAFEEKTFRQSREIIDNKLQGENLLDKAEPSLFDFLEDKNKPIQQEKIAEPIIKGLDFSPAEDKLIHTISLLLSQKSERYDQNSPNYYMGNYEKGVISLNSIDIETARIIITPHELYSTYLGRKNYNTDHIKFILKTLEDLAKRNFMVTLNFPSKLSKANEKKKLDKMRTYLPIFQIAILNPDLTESESQEIDNNDLLVEGKKCHFLFKFGPLFTNNIRDRYVEFPEDIHLRISNSKAAGAKGRIPQCVNLMRDLIFREKQQKRCIISRNEETLVHTLGLSKEWEDGKKGRVRERLNKSFDIFTEIGLLKDVQKTTGSRGQIKYDIVINSNFK